MFDVSGGPILVPCVCLHGKHSGSLRGGGGYLKRLRDYSVDMGPAHVQLQWGKLLWSHLWIDHMTGRLASRIASIVCLVPK